MASLRTGLWGLTSGDVKNTDVCLMLPVSWMRAEMTAGSLLPISFLTPEFADCFFVYWSSLCLVKKELPSCIPWER